MADYACALIIQDGMLLLGRRAPFRKTYADKWDVIGGKVEEGEKLEDALARELQEEIGIRPSATAAFDIIVDVGLNSASPPKYHYYLVTKWQGDPAISNHEHSDLRWFTFADAAALPDLALPDYVDLFERLSFGESGL